MPSSDGCLNADGRARQVPIIAGMWRFLLKTLIPKRSMPVALLFEPIANGCKKMPNTISESIFDDDYSEESEFAQRGISQAVVFGADWTVETLLSQMQKGNIQIDPVFQRRDAWTAARKSRLIESLIVGLPVPQVVLAEKKGERGKFIVLDGKQRLLTLLQFTDQRKGAAQFRLTDLPFRPDLKGLTFANIKETEDGSSFLNQTVRSVVIRNWPSNDFLHTVFVRLNTENVPLSPQELRGALFPGGFVSYVSSFSADSEALQKVLRLDGPDFRMRDVEMYVRLFGLSFFIDDYAGNLKKFLDDTCRKLNQAWEQDEQIIRDQGNKIDRSLVAVNAVFGTSAGRKIVNGVPETRPNRAVLEVQSYYLMNEAFVSFARTRSTEIVALFSEVCERSDFRRAVETTTKSKGAFTERFSIWESALEAHFSLNPAPVVPSLG